MAKVNAKSAIQLPNESIEQLRKDQRLLLDLLPEFDKFEECGGECQEMRAATEAAVNAMAKIVHYYGA